MSSLVHISASPRGEASESLAIARTFLDVLAEEHPDVTVDTWDLWDGTLPHFGPDAVAGKYAIFAGADHTATQAQAWAAVRETFDRFNQYDYYLFSVPMWNHGVPYVLKQLIDVISQPGLVYGFDPDAGYTGLVSGKKAVVIYTSGVYGEGRGQAFGVDFQESYLNDWLRWAGIDDVDQITFRPTLAVADAGPGRQAAHAAARDAAKALSPHRDGLTLKENPVLTVPHISRAELAAALEQGGLTLVDALPSSYYEQLHLPGAVNLVESDVASRAAELLPDADAPIVVYCSNESCRNSEQVWTRLTNLGYTNVRTYREGIQDWVAAGLPVESGRAPRVA